MSKSGIVNVRMVITEEKILSNIDKVQKLINPKSKKQIIQLEDDTYFKDLVESIKTYLIEYPKKKNFPTSVYKAAYGLVEFATNQFEDNTKKIEELIRQREQNIALAGQLKELIETVVKPAVANDGGNIEFHSFNKGVVTVILQGSCSGCPSSTITLKAGIEAMLKRMVPEVTEVISEMG